MPYQTPQEGHARAPRAAPALRAVHSALRPTARRVLWLIAAMFVVLTLSGWPDAVYAALALAAGVTVTAYWEGLRK